VVKEDYIKELQKGNLKAQVRCLRLDGVGFEHTWPRWGYYQFNQGAQFEFKIADPPNHLKKRKDDIFDISKMLKRGKNRLEIYQYKEL